MTPHRSFASNNALPGPLLYISPRFPSLSGVFEQNEILGLISTGVTLSVLSCRPRLPRELAEVHEFARPLLDHATWPDPKSSLFGCVLALARRPMAVGKNALRCLQALARPRAFPRVLAAFVVSLSAYSSFRRSGVAWIHADFGSNSATVAWFLATLLDVPFSYKVHAFEIYSSDPWNADPLRVSKFQNASLVFSEHRYGAEILADLVGGDAAEILVNYSSVRCEDFVPLPPPPFTSNLFSALGRLVPKKGFNVLIRAVARLRDRGIDVSLDIHGDGPEEGRLRNLIREEDLCDRVTLRGRYQNQDMPHFLHDALAVVVPSVVGPDDDMDGVPTVLYEARALGRPVIASAISGIPEVVCDGVSGFLVPPGDVSALAASMVAVLEDRRLLASLAEAGRLEVEREHDHRTQASRLLSAIRDHLTSSTSSEVT